MDKEMIIETAKKIGRAIKESELMVAYEAAEKKYAEDSALQDKIREYSVQQQALAEESAKSVPNAFLTESLQRRLQSLYEEIVGNATFMEFSQAQDTVRALLNEVNQTIMSEVTGEQPEGGCTHDCSTCAGCH